MSIKTCFLSHWFYYFKNEISVDNSVDYGLVMKNKLLKLYQMPFPLKIFPSFIEFQLTNSIFIKFYIFKNLINVPFIERCMVNISTYSYDVFACIINNLTDLTYVYR